MTRKRRMPPRRPGRSTGPRTGGRLQRAIDAVVKREIIAALEETGGNVLQAARALGLAQPSLYKRLTALGIDPNRYRK